MKAGADLKYPHKQDVLHESASNTFSMTQSEYS